MNQSEPLPPSGSHPLPPEGSTPIPTSGAAPPLDPNSVKPVHLQVPGPLKAAGSGIGVASDYFTAGLLAPENALARDIHHINQEHVPLETILKHDERAFPNLANIRKTINQHGFSPEAAHKIAGEEGLTDLGGAGPGTFLDKAPGWAKAGLEIGEGFLAPTGEITGPIAALAARTGAHAALKAGALAARVAPKATDQLQAIKEGMAPFSGLRRAAIKAGVDPNKAEQVGRAFKSSESVAKHAAPVLAKKYFDGLTKEERIEVSRLSENFGPKGVVNPSKLPDPDGKLWFRAKGVRNEYLDTTEKLKQFNLLRDKGTPGNAPVIHDPHTYSYRGGDVYNRSTLSKEEEEAFKRAGGAAPTHAAGISLGAARKEHKVFATHDDVAKAGWSFRDDYDPAKQFEAYIERSYTSIAKEQSIRQLRQIGMLRDVTVVDHQGNVLGVGKGGGAAAAATGRGIAQSHAYDEAKDVLNNVRAARGEAPLNPQQIAAMQKAVAGKGRSFRAMQAANQAQSTTGALAARTAKAATNVNARAGTQLLAQLQSKVDTVDKLNAKIGAMRTQAGTADKALAAKQMGIMLTARDHAAQQIEDMRDAVELQARQALGISKPSKLEAATRAYEDAAATHGVNSPQAAAAFKATQGLKPEVNVSQIYAPIVGHLQEIRQSAMALPSGPARAKVLRQLNGLGERALHNPGKTAAAVDRHGDRMLKHLQRAMSTVAQAGVDPTAQQMVRDLQRTAAKMTADITRQSGTLYARTGQISKPAYQAATIVAGADAKAALKAKAALAAYDKAKSATPDMALFRKAFSSAIVGQASKQTEKIMRASEEQGFKAHGQRFAVGETSAIPGSPSAEFATARQEVIRFFQAQGAQPGDAHSVSGFIDGMNSLARIGMITNPVVHAGWNLGTHFLASGGNLSFMAHNLWKDTKDWTPEYSKFFGRSMGGHEWEALADQNNALMHQPLTHGMFNGAGPGVWSERNMGERFDQVTANLWNWNQKVVFDQAESRYATELFKHFVENKGMQPAEAGIAVRHALGDYTNISRTGIDQALRKTLFFYGWMKSALPFWAGMIVRNPKAFAAPTRAESIYNTAVGDPNPRTGRFYEGQDASGQAMYRTDPGPWKYAADLLEMAAPGGDPTEAGFQSTGKQFLKMYQSHLSPIGMGGFQNQAITFGKTLAGDATEPTQANQFDVMFNKGESPGVVRQQVADYEKKGFPMAGLATGVGDAVGRFAHGDARGLLSAVGGSEYPDLDPAIKKQIYKAQTRLTRDLAKAKKAGKDDPETGQQMRAAARARFEQRVKDAQPATTAVSYPAPPPSSIAYPPPPPGSTEYPPPPPGSTEVSP